MGGLVISGGRVVDPASGMGCRRRRGAAGWQDRRCRGEALGGAERVIDAAGLVVAPGFIDLHAHGQSIPADRMQAFDGVTTTLDLEAGAMPVGSWYQRQAAQGRVLNYGRLRQLGVRPHRRAMTGANDEDRLLEAFAGTRHAGPAPLGGRMSLTKRR